MNESISWAKLTDYAVLTIEGDLQKVKTFLQGQLSCDMNDIHAHQSRLAAYCNHKGRLEASLRVFEFQNQCYFYLPEGMADHTIALLNKYAAFSRLKVTHASKNIQLIGFAGSIDLKVLAPYFSANLPEIPDAAVSSESGMLMALPGKEKNLRYMIAGTTELIAQLSEQLAVKHKPMPLWQWHLSDIEAGIVNIHPETAGLFTPHKINYPKLNAVSFSKGCFIGQEIITRTEHLGKSKHQLELRAIKTDTPPKRGEYLYADEKKEQPTGRIADIERDLTDPNTYQALVVK